jgi:hypothetical protein
MNSFVNGLVVTVALAATGSAAQQKLDPKQADAIRQRLEEVKDRLQLTPEQIERIRPILTTELERVRATLEKHDPQTRRGKIGVGRDLKQIQGEIEKQLKPILTKPQLQELARIREEFRGRIRAARGSGS